MFALFAPGSGVIRVGDTTEHGGVVISGQDNWVSHGKAVAVVGDVVQCPKHGAQRILEGLPSCTVNGKAVAFHGCLTTCGARLISSMNQIHCIGADDDSPRSTQMSQNTPTYSHAPVPMNQGYNRHVQLLDQDGNPLAGVLYTLVSVSAGKLRGVTDAAGRSSIIEGVQGDSFDVYVGVEES
ncbi:PAAR domain-containing protein [Halomonas binhaiensis]|uniref:PAAR domain-containing protein n=1 Tax=Halomonas binhaiensis TaxID=2562282 RepID=A0A5C1NPP2_9GAMM|nr:PAAR domain-containing protein [Halomonas binhaiensis]QEM83769.1 PAAR domain-containing protein [Halomonas binhaiensis]